jgi:hypothetical protein
MLRTMNINKNFALLRVGFFMFYFGVAIIVYSILFTNDSLIPIAAYTSMPGLLIIFLAFRCSKCKEFIFPYFWNPIRSLELTAKILFFQKIECPYCHKMNGASMGK